MDVVIAGAIGPAAIDKLVASRSSTDNGMIHWVGSGRVKLLQEKPTNCSTGNDKVITTMTIRRSDDHTYFARSAVADLEEVARLFRASVLSQLVCSEMED